MPRMTFIAADGNHLVVNAPIGDSVLDIAHDNQIAIEGACEGSTACSTCHVIIDKSWFRKLDEVSED